MIIAFLLWTHVVKLWIKMLPELKGIIIKVVEEFLLHFLLEMSFRGKDPIETTVKEILSLTKMNWNGGELYKTFPVTLDFSKTAFPDMRNRQKHYKLFLMILDFLCKKIFTVKTILSSTKDLPSSSPILPISHKAFLLFLLLLQAAS